MHQRGILDVADNPIPSPATRHAMAYPPAVPTISAKPRATDAVPSAFYLLPLRAACMVCCTRPHKTTGRGGNISGDCQPHMQPRPTGVHLVWCPLSVSCSCRAASARRRFFWILPVTATRGNGEVVGGGGERPRHTQWRTRCRPQVQHTGFKTRAQLPHRVCRALAGMQGVRAGARACVRMRAYALDQWPHSGDEMKCARCLAAHYDAGPTCHGVRRHEEHVLGHLKVRNFVLAKVPYLFRSGGGPSAQDDARAHLLAHAVAGHPNHLIARKHVYRGSGTTAACVNTRLCSQGCCARTTAREGCTGARKADRGSRQKWVRARGRELLGPSAAGSSHSSPLPPTPLPPTLR